MVKITRAKDFNDELQREQYLQEIEKAATTDQLKKLAALSKDAGMVAMLDLYNA